MQQSDPRFPIIIGMIVLAVIAFGGIVWAVAFLPDETYGRYDPNVSFVDENDPVYGNSESPVTIRIFEDFQCSACAVAAEGLAYVRQAYGDRVHIVWNDFPLSGGHPNALLAANAGRCAEEQGKFWEYGDLLYQGQMAWYEQADPTEIFVSYAKGLEMNEAAFTVCLDERTYNEKIQNDVKEGIANRVDSTPTFFVNNKRYVGAYTAAQWDGVLQPLLNGTEPAAAEESGQAPLLDLESEGAFPTSGFSEGE
jgi:protein-disulfide isomerase